MRAHRALEEMRHARWLYVFLHHQLPQLTTNSSTRRIFMAKGQQRKTKEAKKPKKQPAPAKLG